jgi:hypothetical protein
MTLVEMVVTVLLSSIMFYIVGHIVIAANTRWMHSNAKVQSDENMLYAKRRVEFMLRNASTEPFVADGSGISEHGSEVGEGDALRFNGDETISVEDGQLVHKRSGVLREVLLRNVSYSSLHVCWGHDPGESVNKWKHSYAMVTFNTEQATSNGDIITSSCSFIVKNRNSGN